MDDFQILLIILSVLSVPLLLLVHWGLERCYVRLARRFCAKRGFTPSRWRCGPAFDDTGVKTEYSIVELDCDHQQKGRQLVRLLVWIFGVRKVLSMGPFPVQEHDSHGTK